MWEPDGPCPGSVIGLARAASGIEERLLECVRARARAGAEANSIETFVMILAGLSDELRECYRRLADLWERRDLAFETRLRLKRIDRHCVWLCRRIHLEQAFFMKLELESRFKEAVSPGAFAIYEELLDVEDRERRLLRARIDRLAQVLSSAEEDGQERLIACMRDFSNSQ